MWTRHSLSFFLIRLWCWSWGVKVSVLLLILIVVGSLVLKRRLKLLESSFQAVLTVPPVAQPDEEALKPCAARSSERPHFAGALKEQEAHGPHLELCADGRMVDYRRLQMPTSDRYLLSLLLILCLWIRRLRDGPRSRD